MATTLVIFDIDGTLLDSAPLHQKAFLAALQTFDLPEIDTNWDAYRHHTDSWTFGEVFFANHERRPRLSELAAFDCSLQEGFRARMDGREMEIAGAIPLLENLANRPTYCTAFATGGLRGVTREKMQLIDAEVGDSLVATASDHTHRDHIVRRAVSLAANYYRCPRFDRIVSIGDGPWDAEAACTVGCEFVGIGPSIGHFKGLCPEANLIPAFDAVDLTRPYPLVDGDPTRVHDPLPPTESCECWEGWSLTD